MSVGLFSLVARAGQGTAGGVLGVVVGGKEGGRVKRFGCRGLYCTWCRTFKIG